MLVAHYSLQVGLGLCPVSQDLEFTRILLKFHDKIVDYTMICSTSNHVGKTEESPLEEAAPCTT